MKVKIEEIVKSINGIKIEKNSLPLRIWYEQRGLPTEIRTENYFTRLTTHGEERHVKRVAIWGKMETVDEFQRRRRHRNARRWCKGSKGSNRRTFEWKEEDGYIWIKLVSKWKCGDVSNRRMVFDGKYLRITLLSDEIGIWYVSSEGQIRFWILPKEIEMVDELMEVAGIMDGELHKKARKSGGMGVKITNSEPQIIKKVVDVFEKHFKIPKEMWRASLIMNMKNSVKEWNHIEDKKLKKFWSEVTGIPIQNFGKTTVMLKYQSKHSPHGILQIRIPSLLFWKFIMAFLKYVRKLMKSKELVIPYLRGLIAAEGGVGLRKDGGISHLLIGATKKTDRKFYKKCLKILGIESKEYEERLEIYGKKNFLVFLKLDLFRLHPSRRSKFLSGLRKMKKLTLANGKWP